ncbi:MAG: hypothetical protein ACI8RZ_006297 [Myxococcota bacterium]|jgi:hypothetical protein
MFWCYIPTVTSNNHAIVWTILGLGLISCNRPCDAELTLNGDDAQSATLVWSARGTESVSLSYDGSGDPEPREATVSSTDGKHTATLWGLQPLAEVAYSFSSPDAKTCSDVMTTGGLPAGLPALTVPTWFEDNSSSWRYIAGVTMGEGGTIFIIDRDGQWRYHQVHESGITVSAVDVADGALWYNSFDQDRSNDIGTVHVRPLLGSTEEIVDTRTEGSHHTFTRLSDGTITVPSLDIRSWYDPDEDEEIDVVGDRILEIAPDGTATEIWSLWDSAEPTKHDAWDSDFYGDVGKDWSHANSVNYSEARDSYLFSLAHLDTIYEINRSTGEVMQVFTQDSVTTGTVYNFQHDPNWTDDGTLILISYPEDEPAMAIEYAVTSAGDLEEIWSFQRETKGSTLLGQARRLDNGNTFLNFGGLGEMREVTAEGGTIWQLNAGLGSWFGNATILDTLPTIP